MWDLDLFLLDLAKKISYIGVHDLLTDQQALLHFLGASTWALFNTVLIRDKSKWFWLSFPIWILSVLYKEFFVDGHLGRLQSGVESNTEFQDMIADLITKLSGLVFYLLAWMKRERKWN